MNRNINSSSLSRLNTANPVGRFLSQGAFSLIEIVLALGIISFALVGIMGLFPVAMKSAQESQRETRAAQIAQQIFTDLKTSTPTNTFIAKSTNVLDPQISVNLGAPSSNVVSYTAEGTPLAEGVSLEAIYRAEVVVRVNDPVNGLARVQVSVEIPANATNRTKYNFVTLMNQK